MLLEFFFLSLLFLSGALSVRAVGASAAAAACTGFLAGTAIYVVWGTLQLATWAPTSPYLTMALTGATAAGMALWKSGELRSDKKTALYLVAGLAVIAIAVVFLRHFHLVKWHTDSFRYISMAAMINTGNAQEVGANFYLTRYPSIPLLHAPANLTDEFYVSALTPLIAFFTLAALGWMFAASRGVRALTRFDWIILCLAIILLISTNRFVWNAFYINGHLYFAALFLLIAGAGWILRTIPDAPRLFLLTLQILSIAALVFTRPEGFMFAAIAVAPTLLDSRLPWRHRAAPLLALGLASLVMHGFLQIFASSHGVALKTHLILGIAFGAACVLASPLLAWREPGRRPLSILTASEIVFWLMLVIFAFLKPEIFELSLQAIAHNLGGAGAWGVTPVALAILTLFAASACREQNLSWLRFPITASVPLYILLAFLRDGAYRIGEGDSLNRMFIQIVPLAVLFIVAAARSDSWGFGLQPRLDGTKPPRTHDEERSRASPLAP